MTAYIDFLRVIKTVRDVFSGPVRTVRAGARREHLLERSAPGGERLIDTDSFCSIQEGFLSVYNANLLKGKSGLRQPVHILLVHLSKYRAIRRFKILVYRTGRVKRHAPFITKCHFRRRFRHAFPGKGIRRMNDMAAHQLRHFSVHIHTIRVIWKVIRILLNLKFD